jgi:hypothetical protein
MASTANAVTTFLNVDLDLRAHKGELKELLRYIDPFVLVLHEIEREASVELNQQCASLEETLVGFIEVIQGLPQQAKDLWNQCEYRRFNVGIQAENTPREEHFSVSSQVIARLADIRSEILITVYAPIDTAPPGSTYVGSSPINDVE